MVKSWKILKFSVHTLFNYIGQSSKLGFYNFHCSAAKVILIQIPSAFHMTIFKDKIIFLRSLQ